MNSKIVETMHFKKNVSDSHKKDIQNPVDISNKKVIDQLNILRAILQNIAFSEKPDFLPFTYKDYVFDSITDPYELVEAFRLRLLAYTESNVEFINPERKTELFPLGLEFDRWDQTSTHFCARRKEDGKLCAYLRLIWDTPIGLQLKVDVSDYREKYKIAEASRSISYPREQPRYVYKTLLTNLKRFAKQKGVHKVVGEAPIYLMKLFAKLHSVPMVPVSHKKEYRTWHVHEKEEWDCKKDITLYGNVIHIDKTPIKDLIIETT